MIALDAFETSNDILDFHSCYQSADSLQIAVASAIELYVGDDAVLHFHIDMAGAHALGFVGGFHCF